MVYRFFIPLALILMRFGDLVDSKPITSQILKDTRISQIVKMMAWHNG